MLSTRGHSGIVVGVDVAKTLGQEFYGAFSVHRVGKSEYNLSPSHVQIRSSSVAGIQSERNKRPVLVSGPKILSLLHTNTWSQVFVNRYLDKTLVPSPKHLV